MTDELANAYARFERAQIELRDAAREVRGIITAQILATTRKAQIPRRAKVIRRNPEASQKLAMSVREMRKEHPYMSQHAIAAALGIDRCMVQYYLSDRCKAWWRVAA